MTGAAMLGELAGIAAADAVERVRLGEIPPTLGAIEDYLKSAMDSFFSKYGPSIGEQIAQYAAPAAQKAVDVIKPALSQTLTEYTPTFAAVTGGMIALAILSGIWISKRTYQGRRRPRRNWSAA